MTGLAVVDFVLPGLERPADPVVRARVRVRGVEAWVDAQVVWDEWSRRRRVGLGALTNRGSLDVLSGLTADLGIPCTSLSDRERRLIGRLPHGAAQVANGLVTRLAVPPVRVSLAIVTARQWRRGLANASRFAPYCRRVVLLRKEPEDLAELLVEASFLGVGVGVQRRDDVDWLAAPADFRPNRYTTSSWLFAEEVFDQVDGIRFGSTAAARVIKG